MKKKCTKKKLTAEQKAAQLKKRKVLAFRKKIRSSFTDAGFTYFSTLDKHFPIGTRTVELDYLFLYENIIVICEDNTKQKKDIDHIRNKNESFAEIRNNKTAFLNWLSNTFPEKATMVKQYRPERYFLYYCTRFHFELLSFLFSGASITPPSFHYHRESWGKNPLCREPRHQAAVR